jgi:hypothetical protein
VGGGMYQWSHPAMPWDATAVVVAPLADTVGPQRVVSGGGGGESCGQPRWAADGELYFVSDRSGWWNVYRDAVHAPVEVSSPPALSTSRVSPPSPLSISYGHGGCLKARHFPPRV